jgi:hypothetical protein
MFQLLFELYRFLSTERFKVAFTLLVRPMEEDAEAHWIEMIARESWRAR